MDMLKQHITHLLWLDGTATVPGVGVFTLQRHSGVVEGGMLCAPHYSVAFERSEVISDEALVSSLSRAGKTNREEAAQKVANASEAFSQALMSQKGIGFDGIGTLKYDASDAPVYTPVSDGALLSSWLKPIALEPIEIKKTDEAKVAAASEALELRRQSLSRSLRRTASSAAAIAVFALIAFVVSQLPSRKLHQPQVASLGIEQLAAAVSVEEPQSTTGVSEPTLVLILNTPSDGTAPAKMRKPMRAGNELMASVGRYCLVVASLASRDEADCYIKAHSTTELPLTLLEADGRWRVFAVSGQSFDEVSALARNLGIYDRYPSAWICRR